MLFRSLGSPSVCQQSANQAGIFISTLTDVLSLECLPSSSGTQGPPPGASTGLAEGRARVFGAMPGPEVALNRGGRSACTGGPGTPCRRPGASGEGGLQREVKARWPECHPEQLRPHANGGLTGGFYRERQGSWGPEGGEGALVNSSPTTLAPNEGRHPFQCSQKLSKVSNSSIIPILHKRKPRLREGSGLPRATQPVCGRAGI